MFKDNKHHLQPVLICSVNELPEEQREYLNSSWAGVFYREFFSRLDEIPFAVLYSDLPSRPNFPVNVLVGLEYLKAGFSWSDKEMYEAFLYNMQVRYALGYDEFVKGYSDLHTLYYFRERLSRYMQEQRVNLLDQAFEQVTDQQITAFQIKTNLQSMDRTQVTSNIHRMGRVQLLVEVLQWVQRIPDENDQERYTADFAPDVRGHAGQYPFPAGKLPVRRKFRVASILIGSAAVSNVRRIQRYLQAKAKDEMAQPAASGAEKCTRNRARGSFWPFLWASLATLSSMAKPKMLAVSY